MWGGGGVQRVGRGVHYIKKKKKKNKTDRLYNSGGS